MRIPDPFENIDSLESNSRRVETKREAFHLADNDSAAGLSWPDKPIGEQCWPGISNKQGRRPTSPPAIPSIHHVCEYLDTAADRPYNTRPRRRRRIGAILMLLLVAVGSFAAGAKVGSERIVRLAQEIRSTLSRSMNDTALVTPRPAEGPVKVAKVASSVDVTSENSLIETTSTELAVEATRPVVSDSTPAIATIPAADTPPISEASPNEHPATASFQTVHPFALADRLLAQAKEEHRPVLFVVHDERDDDRGLERWEQFVSWPSPFRHSLRQIVEDFVVVPVSKQETHSLSQRLGNVSFPAPHDGSPQLVIAHSDGQQFASLTDAVDRQQLTRALAEGWVSQANAHRPSLERLRQAESVLAGIDPKLVDRLHHRVALH